MVLFVNNIIAHTTYHLDTSAPGSKIIHWFLGMKMCKQESQKRATCLYPEEVKDLYIERQILRSKCGNNYLLVFVTNY